MSFSTSAARSPEFDIPGSEKIWETNEPLFDPSETVVPLYTSETVERLEELQEQNVAIKGEIHTRVSQLLASGEWEKFLKDLPQGMRASLEKVRAEIDASSGIIQKTPLEVLQEKVSNDPRFVSTVAEEFEKAEKETHTILEKMKKGLLWTARVITWPARKFWEEYKKAPRWQQVTLAVLLLGLGVLGTFKLLSSAGGVAAANIASAGGESVGAIATESVASEGTAELFSGALEGLGGSATPEQLAEAGELLRGPGGL
jgi:hypothetical protein